MYPDIPRSVSHPPRQSRGERVCAHWPLEGVVRIHAVAVSLGTISAQWGQPDAGPGHAMQLLDDVRQARMQIMSLWRDFQRVGDWLDRGGQTGTPDVPAPGAGRPAARGLVTSLVEAERLLAKDRLAADMNRLIAWLLQQVLRRLDDLPLRTDGDDTDLLDLAAYGQTLHVAAIALNNAARMADTSERFVEELDGRWHQLRDEVAAVVAMAREPFSRAA